MKAWGLESEFQYHGVLDRSHKIQFLQQLDVFSVPVVFDDPKGLPVLEAMACGVPVVQPRRGGSPKSKQTLRVESSLRARKRPRTGKRSFALCCWTRSWPGL